MTVCRYIEEVSRDMTPEPRSELREETNQVESRIRTGKDEGKGLEAGVF